MYHAHAAKLRRLWGFLSDWQASHPNGPGPTMLDIVSGLGLSSTSVAAWWVCELEASGYITRMRGAHGARTIRVLVPLVTR